MTGFRGGIALAFMIVAAWLPAGCGLSDGDGGNAGAERLEMIARVDQGGGNFVFYGYVTAVNGIPRELLFAAGTPPAERGAPQALVTFHGSTQMTARSILENIFAVTSSGQFNFYHNDQGADFADPASFQRGEQIAVASVSFQNVVTVIAPDTGISNGAGTLIFSEIESFELGDDEYNLAEDDEHQRITAIGSGIRLEPTTPIAQLHVSATTFAIGGDDD